MTDDSARHTGHTIAPSSLAGFCVAVLLKHNVPRADAVLVADTLVQADLWGQHSHGVRRLPTYIERIRTGAMAAVTVPVTVVDTGPMLLLDGNDGLGQVLAETASLEAVRRSRLYGVGAVAVRNSNHFGTDRYFTRRMAADGCFAILTSNASPVMARWAGRANAVGANPWSFAAPHGGGTVVLDVANAATAKERICRAHRRPEHTGTDYARSSGGLQPTTPSDGGLSITAPMGGHKGYAVAFMTDVLAGVLTGSKSGLGVHGPDEADRRSSSGHMFIALDIATFGAAKDFSSRLDALIGEAKASPEDFYPGELDVRHEVAVRAGGGISLSDAILQSLRKLGFETGITLL